MRISEANVRFEREDNMLVAYIVGEIDHHNAKGVRRCIDRELESSVPKELVLDLSGVGFMDSSGLGLILGRYAKAQELRADFCVRHPTEATMKILTLAGGERLIRIVR